MNHYKDSNGNVRGYAADGSQDHLIPEGFVLMTPAEFELYRNPPKSLAQQLATAIAATYSDVDAIYSGAIGSRTPEYEQAEQAALAFQAAGYTGAASPYVSDYATTMGITDQQSADIIIARANALRAAALSMRSTRFTSQAAMRAATTQGELDAAIATWGTFVTQMRASLGL